MVGDSANGGGFVQINLKADYAAALQMCFFDQETFEPYVFHSVGLGVGVGLGLRVRVRLTLTLP